MKHYGISSPGTACPPKYIKYSVGAGCTDIPFLEHPGSLGMTSGHPRLEVNEVDDTTIEKVPSTPRLMINRLAGSARLITGSHVRPAASYMPLHHYLFFCLPCHSPAARVRVQLKQCPCLDIRKYPKPGFILMDIARQYPWITTLYPISQAPSWSLVKS